MDTFAAHPLAVRLGSAINVAYQEGFDAEALRVAALKIRETLPSEERDSFTDAVERCGLWLDEAGVR
jgi:hypothetical protein